MTFREFHLTVSAPAVFSDQHIARRLGEMKLGVPEWSIANVTPDAHLNYANYPTFVVAQWIDNDRARLEFVQGAGKMYADRGEEYPDVQLAKFLRDYTEHSMPEPDGDDVSGSLLNYALGTVDWLELAREYMKENR